MSGQEERSWQCARCGVALVKQKVNFSYMGRTFGHEVPVCPKCGMVFISRELAKGRMAEVELLMEDK